LIEGKFGKRNYKFTHRHRLDEIPFLEAMKKRKRSFLSKFPNGEEIAISVWTTPKRTKTPPWPRIYYTLPHDGKKFTIIPVQASYGRYGDQNIIQPNTISWITAIADIYVIIGIYAHAERRAKGAPSANTKSSKQSTQGNMVFTKFQYQLDEIVNQITEIVKTNPDVNLWNQAQIHKIPMLLKRSTDYNKKLGKKLGVEVQNFSNLERKIKDWKDHNTFLNEFDERSVSAQNREYNSSQKLENIPGKKGIVNINVPDFPKLHLTVDSMKDDPNKKIVYLLEGKNSTRDEFPEKDMVLEQLVKLMVFKNCDFHIKGKAYDKQLTCYVTGKGKPPIDKIKEKYQEIIDECNANKIQFVFNRKVISKN